MTSAPRPPAAAAAPPPAARPSFGADGLPPLHVPLRFFVTAALFGMLAGLLWASEGDSGFDTRWSSTMLASTHLLVLGFFTMVMFGALFQVIPVLGGGGVPRASLVASIVHPGLAAGTLCLAFGLWRTMPGLLLAALCVLATTFAVFLLAAGRRLLASSAPALRPLRWALVAFLGTIAMGMLMAVAMVDPSLGIPFRNWTNAHATWGGMGFGFVLVVGVSHQVVPMFHVTPPFAPLLVRGVAPLVGAGLALLLVPHPGAAAAGALLLTAAALVHTFATLRLLARRRRRRRDATVRAWQFALPAMSVALLLGTAIVLLPEALGFAPGGPGELLVGLLFALGGLGTIVFGMLPKVVSFLAFLHLQRRCLQSRDAAAWLPTMDEFVSQRQAFALLAVHLVAVGLVLSSLFAAGLRRCAGAGAFADFALLLAMLATVAVRYRRASRRIAACLAAGERR